MSLTYDDKDLTIGAITLSFMLEMSSEGNLQAEMTGRPGWLGFVNFR